MLFPFKGPYKIERSMKAYIVLKEYQIDHYGFNSRCHIDIEDIMSEMYTGWDGNGSYIEFLEGYKCFRRMIRVKGNKKVFRIIIPKGSYIIECKNGMIVSSDIIIKPYYYERIGFLGLNIRMKYTDNIWNTHMNY